MALQARDILNDFWSTPERRLQWRMAAVWSSWPMVVGQDIAELAQPLGRSKSTLLLGVEDPMVMQEMYFHSPAIVCAVNAALGENVFDKVRLDLLGGRSSLIAVANTMEDELQARRKAASGAAFESDAARDVRLSAGQGSSKRFSAVPALERCYQAYRRALGRIETQHECVVPHHDKPGD